VLVILNARGKTTDGLTCLKDADAHSKPIQLMISRISRAALREIKGETDSQATGVSLDVPKHR